MTHSYLKKNSVYQGKNIPLDNALKTVSGHMTSEAMHMNTLEHLTHKINWRHPDGVLSKSPEEKEEVKLRKASCK